MDRFFLNVNTTLIFLLHLHSFLLKKTKLYIMRKHYLMMFFIVLFAITSTVAQNFSLLSATKKLIVKKN